LTRTPDKHKGYLPTIKPDAFANQIVEITRMTMNKDTTKQITIMSPKPPKKNWKQRKNLNWQRIAEKLKKYK